MVGAGTPTATIIGREDKTELDQLKEWVEEEKKKGLIDIKFYTADVFYATSESFARDVNRMINGKRVPITDID